MEDIFALVSWADISTYVTAGIGGMVGISLVFFGGRHLTHLLRLSLRRIIES